MQRNFGIAQMPNSPGTYIYRRNGKLCGSFSNVIMQIFMTLHKCLTRMEHIYTVGMESYVVVLVM